MSRTIFTNAVMVDGEHPAKSDSTVAVEGDRITLVATGAIDVEPHDRVIDCGGLTVMPGMVSGHYHSTYHMLDNYMMPPLGLERAPAYAAYVAAYNVRLALESGFTSVVGANEAWDIDPSLAEAIADGFVVGARIVAGSREMLTTADSNDIVPWYWEAQALAGMRICNGEEEFRRAVREEIKRGAQIVKLFASGGHGVRLSAEKSSITQAELNAAVDAAHRLGKRARAHVASKPGIMMCLEAGVDVIDHGDEIDDECIKLMAERDIIWIPSIHAFLRSLEAMGDADPKTGFKSELGVVFRATCEVLPAAVEGGVKVCLGDDYGAALLPHGSYGRELGMYAHWTGIPALEIMRWATANGGALVGREDLGRIQEGQLADIVVVDGNPLEDLDVLADVDNIRAVMRDGQIWVDKLNK